MALDDLISLEDTFLIGLVILAECELVQSVCVFVFFFSTAIRQQYERKLEHITIFRLVRLEQSLDCLV